MCKYIHALAIIMILFLFALSSTGIYITYHKTVECNNKNSNFMRFKDAYASLEDIYDKVSLEALIRDDSKIYDLYQLLFRIRDINNSIYPGAVVPPRFFYAVETYQRSAEYMFKTGWSSNFDNFTHYIFVWIQTGNKTWLKRALKLLNWALNSYLYNSTTGLFSKDSSGLSTEISFPLWYLYIFTHNNTYKRILERMLYGLLNAMMNVNSTFYRSGILSKPYLYIPPHRIYTNGKLWESDYIYYAYIWIGGSLYMLQIIDFLNNQTLLDMYRRVLNETFCLLYGESSGKPFLWEFYNPFTGSKTVYWGVPQTRTFFFPLVPFVAETLNDESIKEMIYSLARALDNAFWSKNLIGKIKFVPYRIWNPSVQLEKYAASAVVALSYLREKFGFGANLQEADNPYFPAIMHYLLTIGIGDTKPIYYWNGVNDPAVYHYVNVYYDSSSDSIKRSISVNDWVEYTLDYYLTSAPFYLWANYPYWGAFLWKKINVYWAKGSGFYYYYSGRKKLTSSIMHTLQPFIYILGRYRVKWYPFSLHNTRFTIVFTNITKKPKEVRILFLEKFPGVSAIWIPLGNASSEYADPYSSGADSEFLVKVNIESNSSSLRWVADKHGLILLYSDEPISLNITAYVDVGIKPNVNDIHAWWNDSDGNGLIDAWEFFYDAHNPNADYDNDSVINSLEQYLFMNPYSNDTDSDRVSDFIELGILSNPLFRDSDYDGVFDYDEISHGYDPRDHMYWYRRNKDYLRYDFLAFWGHNYEGEFNVTEEINKDHDGDGVSTYDEILSGHNPYDSREEYAIIEYTKVVNGNEFRAYLKSLTNEDLRVNVYVNSEYIGQISRYESILTLPAYKLKVSESNNVTFELVYDGETFDVKNVSVSVNFHYEIRFVSPYDKTIENNSILFLRNKSDVLVLVKSNLYINASLNGKAIESSNPNELNISIEEIERASLISLNFSAKDKVIPLSFCLIPYSIKEYGKRTYNGTSFLELIIGNEIENIEVYNASLISLIKDNISRAILKVVGAGLVKVKLKIRISEPLSGEAEIIESISVGLISGDLENVNYVGRNLSLNIKINIVFEKIKDTDLAEFVLYVNSLKIMDLIIQDNGTFNREISVSIADILRNYELINITLMSYAIIEDGKFPIKSSSKTIVIADPDNDGLNTTLENNIGTNPLSNDTDGDGLSDYEEYFIYGTNPLNKDSDEDGWSDGDEISKGTDPLDENSKPEENPPNSDKEEPPVNLHVPKKDGEHLIILLTALTLMITLSIFYERILNFFRKVLMIKRHKSKVR